MEFLHILLLLILSLCLSLSIHPSWICKTSATLCSPCFVRFSSFFLYPRTLQRRKIICFGRMRNLTLLKRKFFEKWMMGLQACSSQNKNMSFFERKKAIKLSANLAMASANDGRTRWSRATIAKALRDEDNKTMAKNILGHHFSPRIQSKKILKRSKIVCIKRRSSISAPRKLPSKWMARNLSKNRTKILKNLLPGGELMDDVSLIEETLDYISSLRAQVDVMRCLVKASECFNRK